MKNIVIIVLALGAVALGAVCVAQHHKLKTESAEITQMQARVAALERDLKEKTDTIENAALAEQKAKILQKTLTETSAAAVEKSQQVEKLQQTLAASKTNDMGNLISGMFKDPKMKEMIKAQQKLVIGPMIDKSYGALFQQLNLSSDQAASLKDLLQQKMMVAADVGTSMLDNSLDASQRADLTKQIKSETDGYDQQIKQLLGDDNYQTFENYEKSVPDRMVVNQFSDQLGSGANALTAAQQEQLVQAMTTDRTAFNWTTDFNNQNQANVDLSTLFTADRINQFAQEKEQFDQQFLTHAQQILTPDQLTAFQQFQTSQRSMQIAGMKIAAQMFGGSGK